MKIYTEVIMEWNEDEGKLVEISSESYEHEGDIALCAKGSGSDQWTVPDDEYGAGYMAAGMTGGRYPGYLPEGYGGGGLDREIFSDEYQVGGARIEETLGAVDPEEISARSGKQHKFKWGWKGGRHWTGQKEQAQAQQVARDFRGDWYDPYVETALTRPFEALATRGLEEVTEESSGLSQEQIDLMEGVGGGQQYGLTEGGKYMAQGSGTELQRLSADFDIAKETREDELQTLQDAEDLNIRDKKEQMKKVGIARGKLSGGVLPAEEALRAEAAGGGFAYSAPGQRQAMATRGQIQSSFKEVTEQERAAREKFDLEEGKIERGRTDVEDAFTAAETLYGQEVANTLLSGKNRVNELLGMADTLLQSHGEYGGQLVEQAPNIGAQYNPEGDWGSWDYANVMRRKTAVGAPTGGYFQENIGGTVPGFSNIESFLTSNLGALTTSAERIEADLTPGGE